MQLKQAPSCSFPERKKKEKHVQLCSDNEPLDREGHKHTYECSHGLHELLLMRKLYDTLFLNSLIQHRNTVPLTCYVII